MTLNVLILRPRLESLNNTQPTNQPTECSASIMVLQSAHCVLENYTVIALCMNIVICIMVAIGSNVFYSLAMTECCIRSKTCQC